MCLLIPVTIRRVLTEQCGWGSWGGASAVGGEVDVQLGAGRAGQGGGKYLLPCEKIHFFADFSGEDARENKKRSSLLF